MIFSRKCVTNPSDLEAQFACCFAPGDGWEEDSVRPCARAGLLQVPTSGIRDCGSEVKIQIKMNVVFKYL